MGAPAGWYDDGTGKLKWYDGQQWTEAPQPLAAMAGMLRPGTSAPAPPEPKQGIAWVVVKVAGALALCIGVWVLAANAWGGFWEKASQDSDDPIEQARVVLLGEYSYEEIKHVTDTALTVTGMQLTDDMRSRAWSSVLVLADTSGVEQMTIMRCVAEGGGGSVQDGVDFPDAAGLCTSVLAL